MPRRAILAALLATTTSACADQAFTSEPSYSEQESAIVGGAEVPAGLWPDAVAVLGTSGTCTGTLVAPDVVITAGHCANNRPVQVIADTIDYAHDDSVSVQVAKTVAYPSWQTSYDLAVLVLASPIDHVEPRRVGTACTFDGFEASSVVRLVGFGATDTLGRAANTRLRQAMTMVTDPDCTEASGCKPAIAPGGEFVAGGTGQADSCFGDSGGPVYLDTPGGPVVIGAVSRGVDGARTPCGGGGIYVRTDKVVDWVEETAGRDIAKDACDGTTRDNGGVLDEASAELGCAATRGSSTGVIALALLGLVRRRRR